jgi:hypothetical protein
MVPVHDTKDLNGHVEAQAARVRGKNLPFVGDPFNIVIMTEASFPSESRILLSQDIEKLDLTYAAPESRAVDAFIGTAERQVNNLRIKLSKLQVVDLQDRVRSMIKQWIIGANLVEDLRDKYEVGYERLISLKERKERQLESDPWLTSLTPRQFLAAVKDEYTGMIRSEADLRCLRPADIEEIARAAIAGWLMECPLDFEEKRNG